MLINAVIIVLREVLEASLIMSLFLAYSQHVTVSRLWLLLGIVLGGLFAWAYAAHISTFSNWFDGVGQEVINAGLQLAIYFILLGFITQALIGVSKPIQRITLISLMVLGIVLASIREGTEIVLFITGFSAAPDLLQAVLIGSSIGAGIGMSVGVCIYYLLVTMTFKNSVRLGYVLTLLIAAAMISQVVQQLIQADWIISQYPLWDTSNWINERSLVGQLLYALIGYEATPTPIQVSAYFSAIAMIVFVSFYQLSRHTK
ncbi:MAG: FTR1 family protein [Gammaproteobacteria bacterium]|nr:FTR1 family protein [Gammaproteobacteria bacterium]MDT8371464.1 FTR1 family protein [Gammaproteobacteria bacterium]